MYKYVYKVNLLIKKNHSLKGRGSKDLSIRNNIKCSAEKQPLCKNILIISDTEITNTEDNHSFFEECKNVLINQGEYDFEICKNEVSLEEYIVCNMEYNEYLPEKFFLLLKYLKEAIYVYKNKIDYKDNIEKIIAKLDSYDFKSQNAIEYKPFSSCPDAEYISIKASYYDQTKVLQYTERVLQEIINVLHIDSIKAYDNIDSIYNIESMSWSCSTVEEKLLNRIQCGMHVLFEVLNSFSSPHRTRNINDFKYRFIKDLKASSLEELFLCLKRSIVLNYKIEALYRENINVSLSGEGDDSIESVNDVERDEIISKISSSFSNHKMVKTMLESFNADHQIMISSTIKKRYLTALIYVMSHSEYVKDNIPFADFRRYVCKYYGKSDTTFKRNDIEQDARNIYNGRAHFYRCDRKYMIKKWW